MGTEDDDLLFIDEDASIEPDRKPWKVLIADDDEDVHLSTKLIFKQFVFQNREIEFLDSYSGAETGTVLRDNPDVAVVLLDVVMETDDAGLKAVKYIRGELPTRSSASSCAPGNPARRRRSRSSSITTSTTTSPNPK